MVKKWIKGDFRIWSDSKMHFERLRAPQLMCFYVLAGYPHYVS